MPKYFLGDDGRIAIRNFDLLAFVLHPYSISAETETEASGHPSESADYVQLDAFGSGISLTSVYGRLHKGFLKQDVFYSDKTHTECFMS